MRVFFFVLVLQALGACTASTEHGAPESRAKAANFASKALFLTPFGGVGSSTRRQILGPVYATFSIFGIQDDSGYEQVKKVNTATTSTFPNPPVWVSASVAWKPGDVLITWLLIVENESGKEHQVSVFDAAREYRGVTRSSLEKTVTTLSPGSSSITFGRTKLKRVQFNRYRPYQYFGVIVTVGGEKIEALPSGC